MRRVAIGISRLEKSNTECMPGRLYSRLNNLPEHNSCRGDGPHSPLSSMPHRPDCVAGLPCSGGNWFDMLRQVAFGDLIGLSSLLLSENLQSALGFIKFQVEQERQCREIPHGMYVCSDGFVLTCQVGPKRGHGTPAR